MGVIILWLSGGFLWAQEPAEGERIPTPAETPIEVLTEEVRPSEGAEGIGDSSSTVVDPNSKQSLAEPVVVAAVGRLDRRPVELRSDITGRYLEPTMPDPNEVAMLYARPTRTTEVIGFVVRGRRLYQRLAVDDLDSIVTPDKERLLPLLRLVRAFELQFTEKDGVITFSPEGVGKVEVDLNNGRLGIEGQYQPLEYLEASSEITLKRDVYVRPEVISAIFDMQLEWNNQLYEYRVNLDRKLSIWKRRGIEWSRATYVPSDIPELLGPADRSDSLLHFLEYRWSPRFRWEPSRESASESMSLPLPRETLWGTLAGGRYKLRMSHPSATWDNTPEDLRWNDENPSAVKVTYAEWVRDFGSGVLALGDSSFGLGDLVFPEGQITGMRINGLLGFTEEELFADRSALGARRSFLKSYTFEGPAPVGSTVDLILNGKVIETEEILLDKDAPLGTGTYQFEDIRLPGGILNEIVILITDADGEETRIEEVIFGSPQLLPKGRASYMAVAGSKRKFDSSSPHDNDDVEVGEIFGLVTGGRILYGVDELMTVGGMFAFQRDFYDDEDEGDLTASELRLYPRSSTHAGATVSTFLLDRFLFSADFAASRGEEEESYEDTAFRARGEYLPTDNISLHLDFAHLGPDYFDGQSLHVADKRAIGLTGNWSFLKKWRLEASAGQAQNNVDGRLDETLRAGYQTLKLYTTALPKTTVGISINRIEPNWERNSKTLSTVSISTRPLPGWDVYGQVARGDTLTYGAHSNLFAGLKMPGVPGSGTQRQSWSIRKSLPRNNSVGATYTQSANSERISLFHDVSIQWKNTLRVHTEVIHDLFTTTPALEYVVRNRAEYFLDDIGYNRLGVESYWQNRNWRITAYLSIRELFTQHAGRLHRVPTRRLRPDYGGVHGRVFVDYNANAKLDPGEPGLSDVEVKLGDLYTAVTNKNGYYVLPGRSRVKQARVFLNLDTLPAVYSPVHGTQLANITAGGLAEVNLSVTPLIWVTGRVKTVDAGNKVKAISGVRVILREPETDRFVADSITAKNGSYYLGNIRAGKYVLEIDIETLPVGFGLAEARRGIEVVPTDEFQEVLVPDFTARWAPVEKP